MLSATQASAFSFNDILDSIMNFIGGTDYLITGQVTDLSNGLVAYYSFGEGAYDSSGNNNHGTLYGNAKSATGKIGQAASFDGVDDSVQVPHSSSLDITNKITLAAWIYPKDKTDGKIIAKDDPADWGCYVLQIQDEKLSLQLDINGWVKTETSALSINQWSHVVGTYDGSHLRIYVNDQLKNSYYKTGVIKSRNINLGIGSRANDVGTQFDFNGLIDEARIYNRALSSTEVQDLYEYAPVTTTSSTSSTTTVLPYGPNCNILVSITLDHYGGICGNALYDKIADLNNDGTITAADFLLAKNMGIANDEVGCLNQLNVEKDPCAPTTTIPPCTDSDGRNPNVYGTISGPTKEGGYVTSYDQCEGTKVREWYCDTDGYVVDEYFECKDCIDGACVEPITTTSSTVKTTTTVQTMCESLYDRIVKSWQKLCNEVDYDKYADVDNSGKVDNADLSYYSANSF